MLSDARRMAADARRGHYAIGAFTIYNMEWAMEALGAAMDEKSPVILGVSEAAARYMGGFAAVSAMVRGLVESLDARVPVALHLDHGSLAAAETCVSSGFTSVMYDGSREPLEENLRKTAALAALAHGAGLSVEAEVGAIAGVEDGRETARGEIADPAVCAAVAATGIDMLAAGIGNMHGAYPPGWKGLDFDALRAIAAAVGDLPLVLHGGTGIPEDQISEAIHLGVAKINVNTECQQGWAAGLRSYITAGRDLEKRGHDPVKLMAGARGNVREVIRAKMRLFGSSGRA